jgi:hypothetical protein
MESNVIDKALWTKAVSLSQNDNKRIESEYIKLRFSKFKKEKTTKRNEGLAKKFTIFLKGFAVFLIFGGIIVFSLKDIDQSDHGQLRVPEESSKENVQSVEILPLKSSVDGILTFNDLNFLNLGQSVTRDSVFYNVFIERKTNGNFLHASVLITNNSTSGKYISISSASLTDDKNRQFEYVSRRRECESDAREEIKGLLKPYIPCKFEFLFEVPPDVITGKLEIEYFFRES